MHLPPEVAEPIVDKIIENLKKIDPLKRGWDELNDREQKLVRLQWRLIVEDL